MPSAFARMRSWCPAAAAACRPASAWPSATGRRKPAWSSVEPAGFDDYGRSLHAGAIVANDRTAGSVCDALLSPSPGAIGFAINRANAATATTVSDDEALAAVAFAFRELKLVVEPGGAVALAALLSGRVDARDRTMVVVLSGGNIDEPVLARALAAADASSNEKGRGRCRAPIFVPAWSR